MNGPASDGLDEATYRAAAGRLAGGLAVVTATWRGSVHATTVSSLTSVSLQPPMLLFCVHTDARLAEALDDVDTWAVSVLADDQEPIARWLAEPGRPTISQLDQVPSTPAPHGGGVWLAGAAAWFACRTSARHEAGDHVVVIGEVLAAQQGRPEAGGLVHLRGRMRPLR